MNLLWEAMVAEMRAVRAEADNWRHFTEDKKPIELIRTQLERWVEPARPIEPEVLAARSATSLRSAAADDMFDVG